MHHLSLAIFINFHDLAPDEVLNKIVLEKVGSMCACIIFPYISSCNIIKFWVSYIQSIYYNN